MAIEACIPRVEEILACWKVELGKDYWGYKNHVYRMLNFCFALHTSNREERDKLIIAGCFHDLGIWANHTFDYLSPSIALAKVYLQDHQLNGWISEIELMIALHHKLRSYRDERYPLVEVFRKGDLVDFSLGLVTCGLPRRYVRQVQTHFPNTGFHWRLVQLEVEWLSGHPANPLPVFKW